MKAENKLTIVFLAVCIIYITIAILNTPKLNLSIGVRSADSVELISGSIPLKGDYTVSHHYDLFYFGAWCNKYKGKWYSSYPYVWDMSDTSIYKNGKLIYKWPHHTATVLWQRYEPIITDSIDFCCFIHSEIQVQELSESEMYYLQFEPRYLNND